jgi:hypothetical protein
LIAAAAIAATSPEIFTSTLGPLGRQPSATLVFLILLTLFLVVVSYGVLRRWRSMFWLVVVAFLAGVLRVPATALELAGVIPMQGPAWYLLVQAVIGLVQLAVGALLIRGYRKGGVWGAF